MAQELRDRGDRDLRRPSRRGRRAEAVADRGRASTRGSSCSLSSCAATRTPPAPLSRFCCGLVDAVAPSVVAVKPQLAFFEALGAEGVRAFEDVCGYARRAGLLVIADGKRGDIGPTARAYATAYLESGTADAPTR